MALTGTVLPTPLAKPSTTALAEPIPIGAFAVAIAGAVGVHIIVAVASAIGAGTAGLAALDDIRLAVVAAAIFLAVARRAAVCANGCIARRGALCKTVIA